MQLKVSSDASSCACCILISLSFSANAISALAASASALAIAAAVVTADEPRERRDEHDALDACLRDPDLELDLDIVGGRSPYGLACSPPWS